MQSFEWCEGVAAAIIVCDTKGIIITMNQQAIQNFEKEGGAALLGTNLYDCHPEPAKNKLRELMTKKTTNVYTIEKNGIKKLIYQTPWHHQNKCAGFVEFSFEIPLEMPHFIR